jgi:glycosyltransferase involved in cell wall biosynthesis
MLRMKKVVTIMACRNEEKNINQVLLSLENQSMAPVQVIIVDDASTDSTYKIIEQFSQRNMNWKIFRRSKNDERYTSIVNVMKKASEMIEKDFDFLMVLDADTILDDKYIEKILHKFELNLKLGITGGILLPIENSKEQFKESYDDKVVFGSNRIYSKKCWNEINGGKILSVKSIAWDTEHCFKAKIRGYEIKRFDDIFSKSIRPPSLNVPFFLRGILKYQFGFGFFNVLISGITNLKPDFVLGYIVAWLSRKPKIDNKENMMKIKNLNDQIFFNNIKKILKLN